MNAVEEEGSDEPLHLLILELCLICQLALPLNSSLLQQHLVGSGKVLLKVEVDEVCVPSYRPRFRYRDKDDPASDWPKGVTLGQLWDSKGCGFMLVMNIAAVELPNSPEDSKKQLTLSNTLDKSTLQGGGPGSGRRRR